MRPPIRHPGTFTEGLGRYRILLQREPPHIPKQLLFTTYICRPQVGLIVDLPIAPEWKIERLSDLFSTTTLHTSQQTALIDILSDAFVTGQEQCIKINGIPDEWHCRLTITHDVLPEIAPLLITLAGKWRYFEAALEAHLMDGSYSVTEEKFIGGQSAPVIDTYGPHPGEGWKELEAKPVAKCPTMTVIFSNSADQIKSQLQENLGSRLLK